MASFEDSESQPTELRRSSRDINPSTDAMEGEMEKCLALDRSRAGYSSQVTKAYSRFRTVIADREASFEDLKGALQSMKAAFVNFAESHNKYLVVAAKCEPEKIKTRIGHFTEVSEIMEGAKREYRDYKLQNMIQPEDSVSQAGGASQASKTSRVSSALAKSAAKKAVLSVKCRLMEEQKAQRLELERKCKEAEMDLQRLELEAELEAVQAEEETLAKFVDGSSPNSRVAPEMPTKKSPSQPEKRPSQQAVSVTSKPSQLNPLSPEWKPPKAQRDDASYVRGSFAGASNVVIPGRIDGDTRGFVTSEPAHQDNIRNYGVFQGFRTPGEVPAQRQDPDPQHHRVVTSSAASQVTSSGALDCRCLIETLKLPKVGITKFDGNPLKYTSFIRNFDAVVGNTSVPDADKFNCLYEYCTETVQRVIECCVHMTPEEGYRRARRLLKERFGDEFKISKAWEMKITKGDPVKPGSGQSLQNLADEIRCCYETLMAIGRTSQVESEDKMLAILRRLPKYFQSRWKRKVRRTREDTGKYPGFSDLVTFLDDVSAEENDPIFGAIEDTKGTRGRNAQNSKKKPSKSFNVQVSEPSKSEVKDSKDSMPKDSKTVLKKKVLKCKVCDKEHSVAACSVFRDMAPDQRLTLVKEKRLCFNCLDFGNHSYKQCRKPQDCNINGCEKKHARMLHDALLKVAEGATSNQDEKVQASSCACAPNDTRTSQIALPIVTVYVRGKGQCDFVKTQALLDPGSNRTFCDMRLAEQLKLEGKPVSLSLETLSDGKDSKANEVSLEVTAGKGKNKKKRVVQLPKVYALDHFPSLKTSVGSQSDVNRWQHLKDLPFAKDGPVMLLIGQDVPSALVPLEVRRGGDNEPYATRTVLGWTLNGPLRGEQISDEDVKCNFIQADWDHDRRLEAQVEQFWKLDTCPALAGSCPQMSRDDRHVLDVWNKSIHKDDGHYEFDIPFKKTHPDLKNNRYMAEKRLQYLGRKLSKDPELYGKYKQGIEDLLKEGFAEPAPDVPTGVEWYLPHHNVVNPNKPDKFRIVFDCAAEYGGTSLNKQVYQGPDLTNQLLGVLLRFREGKIGVQADIRSMFHMVKVSPAHRDALRFLWWEDGIIGAKLVAYRMTVHLFGGIWSPSVAGFALRRVAEENADKYSPLTIETVLWCFYVDDLLRSLNSTDQAIKLVRELRDLLKEGGFDLTKFISNSKEVLQSIPQAEWAKEAKSLDLDADSLPVERALGVHWDTEEDTLFIKVREKEPVFTRRGLLRIYSSVYDPLGFVSPFILTPKKIFQAECRLGKGWDDELEPENVKMWQKWLEDLSKLVEFKLPRYLLPLDFGDVEETKLHHFCDASTECYGAVSYLRAVDAQGRVHCAFLISKSRLAPMKQMSIPRLELSAAVVAVNLDSLLRRHMKIDLQESVFWTDSTVVLQYITNRTKRFHTFVANRVAVIQDGSRPDQWRYVNTNDNPADDISRGLKAAEMLSNQRWRDGPEFLWQSEECWPTIPDGAAICLNEDDPEVKREAKTCAVTAEEEDIIFQFLSRYSSWFNLRKGVAWILRMLKWLREGRPKGMPEPLTVREIKDAEAAILRFLQERRYHQEIEKLINGGKVPKSSRIYDLEPFLDQDGLMKVKGRLDAAPIDETAKHPVIIPRDTHVALLIVRHVHEWEARHSGREYVMAKLRRKYWIPRVRPLVKKVLRRCVICRHLRGGLGSQRMADLPSDRVSPGSPPWTYCGIDAFGHFYVKRGRSHEKRWGCIFSCQTTRAIHIEKLHTMESDSFLNSLIRFTARRGVPKKIRSDNGGNFTLGEKELRKSIEDWNKSNKTRQDLLLREIEWSFQVSRASHMSGSTERQIRTVRKVLNAILRNQVLDDEKLDTIFAEVENIVNSRPLTFVSDDPRDPHPLTPNDLIRVGEGFKAPPGNFGKADAYGKRWRHVQLVVNQFWKRWTAEYLPTLMRRSKWITQRRNLQVNDVVLILDESQPRSHWPLGRVIKTFPGKDGLVRAVELKTARSDSLMRPIHKVCLLEATHEDLDKDFD